MLLANSSHNSVQKVQADTVVNLLDKINVCKRCDIRVLLGNYAEYKGDNETPIARGSHCSACLGILEEATLQKVAAEVAEKWEASNYDSPTFQLGVSLPQCLILRQPAIVTYLMDHGIFDMNHQFSSIKIVAKHVLSEMIQNLTNKKLDNYSGLFIRVDFTYPDDATEISKLSSSMGKVSNRKRKKGLKNQQQIQYHGKGSGTYSFDELQRKVQSLQMHEIKRYIAVPPVALTEACDFNLTFLSSSIFVGGRYNKYSRTLSQTPWLIEGKRHGETSTSELIGEKLKDLYEACDTKFQSSGREDVDVRMLGTGRPFAVELVDPKITQVTQDQLSKIQVDINSATDLIAVRDLQVVNKAGMNLLKKGEETKKKLYRAKVWCAESISDQSIEKLNSVKDIVLQQKTPLRVLHRRPLCTRLRTVHEIEMKRLDEDEHYEVNLLTQAGTYIKEFVHGDFGRTTPSMVSILEVPIDIIELDVMDVDLAWPPETDSKRHMPKADKSENNYLNSEGTSERMEDPDLPEE